METPKSDDGIYARLDDGSIIPQESASRPDLGERGALNSVNTAVELDSPVDVPQTSDDLAEISTEWAVGYTESRTLATITPVEEVLFNSDASRIRMPDSANTIRIGHSLTRLYVDGIVVVDASDIPDENLDASVHDHSNGYSSSQLTAEFLDELDVAPCSVGSSHSWYHVRNGDDRQTRGPNDEGALYIHRSDVDIPDEYPQDSHYNHLPVDLTDDIVLDGWDRPDDLELENSVIQATEILSVPNSEVPRE